MTEERILKVGQFTFDRETGTVTGPADYMKAQGLDRIKSIEAGADVVFNMNPNSLSDPALGVLVSLQTDYAAFAGMKQFNAMREAYAKEA